MRKPGIARFVAAAAAVAAFAAFAVPAAAQQAKKPNILDIWGDDIGEFNISA